MAERRATNKYYPPEWEPEHGSISRFAREFAKGRLPPASVLGASIGVTTHGRQGQSIQLVDRQIDPRVRRIRFELPMPIWCGGCGRHIAKNVRFNADKRQFDWYHSTPVYQFTFLCPSCPQQIVLSSDPVNTDYKVHSGAKAKTEVWEEEEEGEDGGSNKVPQEEGPFAQLERKLDKERKAAQAKPVLEELEKIQGAAWENDFATSQRLRKQFREAKKREKRERGDPMAMALKKYGLSVNVEPKKPIAKQKREFQWEFKND